jgi:16S rRNA (adenine1518-N6/adenine1519-N6)-dimethyltransferase
VPSAPPPPPPDLGQHLLRDARAIGRVVDAARLRRGETVLDAGAGAGALTRPLAEVVGPEGRVVAVEIDPAMAARLRDGLPPHVEVVEADLLDVPFPEGLHAVVANPPFRIAAPLVERIVEARVPRAVLVLPRELIDRLVARPGTERYGKLTVRVALRAHAEDLGYLSRHAFDPPPDVVSGLLRLRPRDEAPEVHAATLDAVLDAAWERWDRKAKHALAPLAPAFRVDSAALMQILKEKGWAEPRACELPPEAFAAVAAHVASGRHGSSSARTG